MNEKIKLFRKLHNCADVFVHSNGHISKYWPDNFTGIRYCWHKNGYPHLKINFKGGHPNGLYEEWDKNGKIIDRIKFKNGFIDLIVKEKL